MANRRDLVSSPRFEKATARYVGRSRDRQDRVAQTLMRLSEDIFHPQLKTHALRGDLAGQYACSCGYDCRILFRLVRDEKRECILLLDIGTHDAVY